MKVLHVITGLNNGGAEAILYNIISNKKHNVEHEVISLSDNGYYGGLIKNKGIKVTTLNITSLTHIFKAIIRLKNIMNNSKPDIVQTWMYHADILGGVAAKISGIKKIFWGIHNSFFIPTETKIYIKFAVKISKLLSFFIPYKIICCSDSAFEAHKKIGYCGRKLTIITNGVDTNLFKPNEERKLIIRKSLGFNQDIFLIGMIARWHIVKDHKTLLSALNLLKRVNFNWKCILVGDNIIEDNINLKNLIIENDLQDLILCLGPSSNVIDIYNAIDLHILCSSSESFGNVTAESMSCGIPCIMTDVGEANNLLSDFGWIMPIRNPIVLEKFVKEAYTEFKKPETWKMRKSNCRKKITDNYSLNRMINTYHEVWSN
jgi:glycosyltransferase involved in cell wall biosynthesis